MQRNQRIVYHLLEFQVVLSFDLTRLVSSFGEIPRNQLRTAFPAHGIDKSMPRCLHGTISQIITLLLDYCFEK